MAIKITKTSLADGLAELARRDADIARVYTQVGLPPMRARPAGFASLLKIICAQQVSTASARAIIAKLETAADPLTPENFLALGGRKIRSIGFSKQKAGYGIAIAEAVLDQRLSFRSVARMDDGAAIAALTELKGVGRWTAEVYLLFALRRPDIWPIGDLGVVKGLMMLKGFETAPDQDALAAMGEAWRPWRSAVARLMWHYFDAQRRERRGAR